MKTKVLLMLLLPISVFALEQNDDVYASKVKIHDNPVCAYSSDGKTQYPISIDENDYTYSITTGQPWGGVFNRGPNASDSANCIVVKAGRHSEIDSNVFDWIGNQGISYSASTFGTNPLNYVSLDFLPEKLNFALKSTLTIEFVDKNDQGKITATRVYTCPNIILAQFPQNQPGFGNSNFWGILTNTPEGSYNTKKLPIQCSLNGEAANVYFIRMTSPAVKGYQIRFSEKE